MEELQKKPTKLSNSITYIGLHCKQPYYTHEKKGKKTRLNMDLPNPKFQQLHPLPH